MLGLKIGLVIYKGGIRKAHTLTAYTEQINNEMFIIASFTDMIF